MLMHKNSSVISTGPATVHHSAGSADSWMSQMPHQKETSPKVRKEMITKIQNMIRERVMWLPLTNSNSPAAFGPKVKGNPYRIPPLIWFTAPFEDIELN